MTNQLRSILICMCIERVLTNQLHPTPVCMLFTRSSAQWKQTSRPNAIWPSKETMRVAR